MSENVQMSDDLKTVAKKLFEEGKIDLLIGYERGTLPLRTTPCFLTSAEGLVPGAVGQGLTDRSSGPAIRPTGTKGVEKLVWDGFCANNLAVYLPRLFSREGRPKEWQPPRVAVVAKGCDGRSLVGLIKEKQVPRENLLIVGVPCHGIVDLKKVEAALDGKTPAGGEIADDGTLTIHFDGGEDIQLKREDVLFDSCRDCPYPDAPVCDIRIGEEPAGKRGEPAFQEVAEFEAKPAQERWEQFVSEISKCIRCYACRQACPNCYCTACFAEQTQPKWMGVGTDLTEVMIYHLGRIFHQAGRCVDCGACVRACPMNVDLRLFTRKMLKDVKELFGYEAGISLEEPPPLCTFTMEDDQSFITEP
jgi:ferredoxin